MTGVLQVGVIGAGYFARYHLDAWTRLPGVRLAAVCDTNARRLSEATSEMPEVVTFTDARAMLDNVKLDLVDIATPPATHLQLVSETAARGLSTICQKPLAPTMVEALRLVETAERAQIELIVHENFRFTPWHQEAARLIKARQLGDLHSITMRLRPGDGQGPEAYLNRQPYFQQMDRFLVHETAIHWIDTFRFLMGEVTGVFARLRRINPVIAGEDAGYIIFAFENGATGLFDGNRLNEHVADNPRLTMGEMWIEGSAGVLRLDGQARLWWKPHDATERIHPFDWNDQGFAGDCVYATQAHIVSHLSEGATPENTGRAYLRNLEIEEAVYRSNVEGRWIDVA